MSTQLVLNGLLEPGNPGEYTLTDDEWGLCEKFSVAKVPTDVYGERDGQTDLERRRQQETFAKAGEIGAHHILGTPPPDFRIYAKEHKTFGPDLGEKVSVKTTEHDSWVFERTDPVAQGRRPGERVVFVRAAGRTMRLMAEIPGSAIAGLLGEVRMEKYRRTKQALYLDRIPAEYRR